MKVEMYETNSYVMRYLVVAPCRLLQNFKMSLTPRVLSIQSHVVHGYVGNKSAVFPMQVLGLEVDFINSVQFSNHTGYKSIKGQSLTDADLEDLMQGLANNNLDTSYSHLLTGYIGTKSFLCQICKIVKYLKQKNPHLIYVCDPVMGDDGKLYVKDELIPIYKEQILSLADIITPNLFEAEILTGMTITTENVWDAVEYLHKKGCQTVVITSAELAKKDYLIVFASSKKGEKISLEIKKLPIKFTGTGDLFSSLFLSWMCKSGGQLKESLEKTVASLQAVIKRTAENLEGRDPTSQNVELKLIQSKHDIENPDVKIKANLIN